MHTFCTLTSQYHISFTLALISKISEPICILTLDEFSYSFFKKNSNKQINVFKINDLERKNLNKLKSNRKRLEYIFTLKPIFIYHLIKNIIKKNQYLIYLDSDIFFFKNSKYLTKNIRKYSIFLTKHNFSKSNKDKEIYGKFNAGFISFKCDKFGKKYSKWWSDQCIKSCKFDVFGKNKIFTDQGYLDYFDNLNKNKIKILDNSIYNLAPWNISNYKINFNRGNFLSDKKKIVFYHFQYFRIFFRIFCLPGLYPYNVNKNEYIEKFYKIYFGEIKKNIKDYKLTFPPLNKPIVSHFLRSLLKLDFKIYF